MINNHLTLCKKKTVLSLLAVFWTLFFASIIPAHDTPPPEKIKKLGLPSLSGEVMVYYSQGYAKRAAYLQDLLVGASRFFKRPEILGVKLDLNLAVLSAEDWAKLTKLPYGVSHILRDSPTAILPAKKKNVMSNGILKNKNRIPVKIHKRLEKLEISFEDAAPTLVDLIGFHEIGHIYAREYGTWPSTMWLNEFIATYLAYAYLKKSRPKLAKVWETMTDALVESSGHAYTTLADFERLYIRVGNENYGWYQGKFQQMVGKVFKKLEILFIHTLKQSLRKNPKVSSNDPFRLQELDTIFKGFSTWAKVPKGNLK